MNIEDITPLHDRVVIHVLPETQEYDGMLDLSAAKTQESSNIALIITLPVGYNETGLLSVGRKVLFNRHSGTVIKLDRFDKHAPEYRLIKEEDIQAILK
jgi:co-chaperonin GroES (HSP10)